MRYTVRIFTHEYSVEFSCGENDDEDDADALALAISSAVEGQGS